MNTFDVDEGGRSSKRPRLDHKPSSSRCDVCLGNNDRGAATCKHCGSRLLKNEIPPMASFEPLPMKKKRSAGPAPAAPTGGVKPPTKEDEAVDALMELAASCVNVSGSPRSDPDSDDDSTITIVEDLPDEAGPTSEPGVTSEDNGDDDDDDNVVNVGPGGYGIPPPMEKTTGPAPAAPTGDIPNPNPELAAGPTPRAARIAFFRVGPLPTEVVPGSINTNAPSGGAGTGSAPIDTSATPSTTTTTTAAEPPPVVVDTCFACGNDGPGEGWRFCINTARRVAKAKALETGSPDLLEKAFVDLDTCVASQYQGLWGGCTRNESRRLAAATETANNALHDAAFDVAVKHQLLICPGCANGKLEESPTCDGHGLSFWQVCQ